MENSLIDLLEELEKAHPNNIRLDSFSQKLVVEALNNNFITTPYNMRDLHQKAMNSDRSVPFVLTSKGFMALQQIRIKNATDELSKTIREFSVNSTKLSSKLNVLTWVMIILIVIQIGITIVTYFANQ